MTGKDLKQVLNIAHRGASAYAYENTIESIEKAIELGADMVEFDLRRTADGVIILWHDPKVRDRSGKWSPILKTTFDELHFFAKEHNFKPARFEDVLKTFGTRISFDIEIKEKGFELEVVNLLSRFPPVFEPSISSFHVKILRRFKQIDSTIKTSLILESRLFKTPILGRLLLMHYILKSGADSIKLELNIANKQNISEIINAGKSVHIWTVNNKKDMRRMIEEGVDGIITDKPDILNEVRGGIAEPALRFSESGQYEKPGSVEG